MAFEVRKVERVCTRFPHGLGWGYGSSDGYFGRHNACWGFCGHLCRTLCKKTHEVAQSQRQIENSLKYVEILNNLLQNNAVSLPNLGALSYQKYLHYHRSHPEEFPVTRSGWPSNNEEAPDNIVFKELLGLFNIFAHSVLVGSANFLILYFYYGEYMQFLRKEMNATEASRKHLANYSDFTEMMEQYADKLRDLPIREHFS